MIRRLLRWPRAPDRATLPSPRMARDLSDQTKSARTLPTLLHAKGGRMTERANRSDTAPDSRRQVLPEVKCIPREIRLWVNRAMDSIVVFG